MSRPLVYYAATIFMGCVTCLILINNPILGAVIAASFLAIMYFTIEKRFFYLVVCFFIIGTVNYYAYFNVNLPNTQNLKVRIFEKSKYYCVAKTGNKKIVLEGNVFNLTEGRSVWIKGDFYKKAVYERGVVGTYKVNDYKICNEDLTSKIESFRRNLYEKFSQKLGKKSQP
jgi:competence protein ComEC